MKPFPGEDKITRTIEGKFLIIFQSMVLADDEIYDWLRTTRVTVAQDILYSTSI